MKKILIISFSVIHSDPRVMRQVRLLGFLFDVTVIGFGKKPDANINFIELRHPSTSLLQKLLQGVMLLLGLFEMRYWRLEYVKQAMGLLSKIGQFDLIIANDISALPLSLKIGNSKTPVLLDAHEYSPREFDEKGLAAIIWKVLPLFMYHLPESSEFHDNGMSRYCRRVSQTIWCYCKSNS